MSAIGALVAGEYFCDVIFSGLDEPPRLGAEFFATGLTVRPGGCYNMALALTRLGVKTAWATDFGDDLFSQLVLREAERDGLDDSAFNRLARSVQRVSAAFNHGQERGFISYSETEVAAPDVTLLDRLQPQWLLQSFRFDADWLSFIQAAKRRGAKVFGDCRHGSFTLDTPGIREFLALADVFSPNEAEALALTGAPDLDAALARLAGLTQSVVVKRGAAGAAAISAGQRYDIAAPTVAVIDTIGAGDAFNAGFLWAALKGENPPACVRAAVLCGTLSTSGAGSSRVPSAAALAAFATSSGILPS